MIEYKSKNIKEENIMPRFISDVCVACGACAAECPVSCITEGDGKFVIDEAECIDCGACEGICPTEAISEK